jgi:hypothetical protein
LTLGYYNSKQIQAGFHCLFTPCVMHIYQHLTHSCVIHNDLDPAACQCVSCQVVLCFNLTCVPVGKCNYYLISQPNTPHYTENTVNQTEVVHRSEIIISHL